MMIHKPGSTFYRGNPIKQTIYNFAISYDGYERAVSQYLNTNKWWIVPSSNEFDDILEAYGPFDTADDALTQIYLMGDLAAEPPVILKDGEDDCDELD